MLLVTSGTPMDPCAADTEETTDLYHSFPTSPRPQRHCRCIGRPASPLGTPHDHFDFKYLFFAYPVAGQVPRSGVVTMKSIQSEKILSETPLITRVSHVELSEKYPTFELKLRFPVLKDSSGGLAWFHFGEFSTCSHVFILLESRLCHHFGRSFDNFLAFTRYCHKVMKMQISRRYISMQVLRPLSVHKLYTFLCPVVRFSCWFAYLLLEMRALSLIHI